MTVMNPADHHSHASFFWETTPLDQMTHDQWESLCDGCGRCCLQKFKDGKTGKITYTWISCYLLDTQTCQCTHYLNRSVQVPDCLHLTPEMIPRLRWLPRTCAYRRVWEGKKLDPWHPLISGDPESVHHADISIRNKAIPETCVHPDDVLFYAVGRRL